MGQTGLSQNFALINIKDLSRVAIIMSNTASETALISSNMCAPGGALCIIWVLGMCPSEWYQFLPCWYKERSPFSRFWNKDGVGFQDFCIRNRVHFHDFHV